MPAQKISTPKQPWIETPLLESAALSRAAGCRIFLKHDFLQPSGSFKSRGLGLFMQRSLLSSPSPSSVHFYCSSGGNAGLACVHAARVLGRPATVVVPESTKPFMVAKLRAAGASDVLIRGRFWAEADRYLREELIRDAERRGEQPVYVTPFDHPEIWEGHSTLVDEVREQLGGGRPDVIVCSSGGGGLFNGVCEGVERYGWHEAGMEVLVMGTVGADALWQSKTQGKKVTLDGITSRATSLGATYVSDRTWELVSTRNYIRAARLTDAEAAMGCWRIADDERILVELACGVNVALCYGGRLEKALGRRVGSEEIVVIEVCGGSAVTVDMIGEWKKEFGHLDDELSREEVKNVPSAATG
ncbi:tryptophan synthase beta subunit-like PLP-dependent enzyme [Myriangium duriaei CBS 260.36]|uniref:L-serine ammonia-lyase n=1 Tax=Myriangium duriaei CBS 260.36 TaxID=1168546 RepID=A0A9P4MJV0_9PEZI|nr:tryptophan synthase beta subunit-like PLP-dependent enzyme [Myriangium duriaei CBS 260.36]